MPYLFWTRMRIKGKECDHLLIREFVTFCALNDPIKNKNFPMRGAERCSKHAKLWQNNVLYFMTADAKPNNSVQYNSKNSINEK